MELETKPILTFQQRVREWMWACFGVRVACDKVERHHRFLEEALELVQASGCSKEAAHDLVEYVFNRPVGELKQEIGGVQVTLAALCHAQGCDMTDCAETELTRCWGNISLIRFKQAQKPKHGPRPE